MAEYLIRSCCACIFSVFFFAFNLSRSSFDLLSIEFGNCGGIRDTFTMSLFSLLVLYTCTCVNAKRKMKALFTLWVHLTKKYSFAVRQISPTHYLRR